MMTLWHHVADADPPASGSYMADTWASVKGVKGSFFIILDHSSTDQVYRDNQAPIDFVLHAHLSGKS